jgi:hypothetical protein
MMGCTRHQNRAITTTGGWSPIRASPKTTDKGRSVSIRHQERGICLLTCTFAGDGSLRARVKVLQLMARSVCTLSAGRRPVGCALGHRRQRRYAGVCVRGIRGDRGQRRLGSSRRRGGGCGDRPPAVVLRRWRAGQASASRSRGARAEGSASRATSTSFHVWCSTKREDARRRPRRMGGGDQKFPAEPPETRQSPPDFSPYAFPGLLGAAHRPGSWASGRRRPATTEGAARG